MTDKSFLNFPFHFPVDKLYSLSEIDIALERVANKINHRFEGKKITLINILQGATVTCAHFMLKLNCLVELDSIHATRYQDKTSGAELEWKQYPGTSLKDKTIILVDDIFDEGITMLEIKNYCIAQGAKEVITVVLLEKNHNRKISNIKPDYSALQVPDLYVFGYGLDYEGLYRNAPGIFSLQIGND